MLCNVTGDSEENSTNVDSLLVLRPKALICRNGERRLLHDVDAMSEKTSNDSNLTAIFSHHITV